MNARTLRRELVRAAGQQRLRFFRASYAIASAESLVEWSKHLSLAAWGELPQVRTRTVHVPRSLRRYFGATVEALP